MPNDLVNLAMQDAVRLFRNEQGNQGDNVFTAASFSHALRHLASLTEGDELDGHLVRAILCGRRDVFPDRAGGFYVYLPGE